MVPCPGIEVERGVTSGCRHGDMIGGRERVCCPTCGGRGTVYVSKLRTIMHAATVNAVLRRPGRDGCEA